LQDEKMVSLSREYPDKIRVEKSEVMVYRVNEPGKEFPLILGLVWVLYSWVWHKKKILYHNDKGFLKIK